MRPSIVLMFAASLSGTALADETPSACADALEQVAALETALPVYKLIGTDSRHYIDDADRPAEIARLRKIIDASCSADRDARHSEETEAERLHLARSVACSDEHDSLSRMEQPDSRDPTDVIAAKRKLVAGMCPAVPMADRWLIAPIVVVR